MVRSLRFRTRLEIPVPGLVPCGQRCTKYLRSGEPQSRGTRITIRRPQPFGEERLMRRIPVLHTLYFYYYLL